MSDAERVYTAALIVIGDEILSGRTQDANIRYTARKMVQRGVRLVEVRVVPDLEERIIETVNALRTRVDYLLTTGGIGPTHDDITAESIAKAFGVELVRDEAAYKALRDHYGGEEITPSRLKMAMVPEGAKLIHNPVSGAPGFIMDNVYVMAGVPHIMQAMLDSVAVTLAGGALVHERTVFCPLPESAVAEPLAELQARYPAVDMGSYPSYREGRFETSLVLRGTDEGVLKQAESEVRSMIERLQLRNSS